MFIFSSTFKGDDFGYGLFKRFLDDYIEKFYVAGGHLYVSKDDTIKSLFDNPSRYKICLGGHDLKTQEEFKTYMTAIATYTREFMNDCSPQRFMEHYEPEWKPYENGFHIAQYNSMKLNTVLRTFAATFARTQLYEIHKLRASAYYKSIGQDIYMTSANGIEEFGISQPNPRFAGQEKDPKHLTTMFPDIKVLKPYFDKYKLVRWQDDTTEDGYYISKFEGYDCERIYGLLNILKYTHLNIGKKGRRVLDIGSKTMHHERKLDQDKQVSGHWDYQNRTVYRKGIQK
jgi:hypothetical protein